jgi:ABC-2 type transport system permease protein
MSGVVWAVVRREYLQRVRSRWFLVGTLALPLFMAGLVFVPAWFAGREAVSSRALMLLDRTGVMAEMLVPRLEMAGFTVRELPPGVERPDQLEVFLEEGRIGGFLVLGDAALVRGRATYHAASPPSPVRTLALRQAVVQTALGLRFDAGGDDVGALLAGGELEVRVRSGEGSAMEEPAFLAAYVGAFMLYMTILLYAVAVMRSVLEEKTNRVVEVVISAMRPFQLMLGKIVGVGAVGLTQLAIWVASGFLLAYFGLPAVAAMNPEGADLGAVLGSVSLARYAAWFVVFFLGGYFMYSGLYAAVGAMCSSDEEAQQAQFPVIMLLVVPVVFVMQVIQEPDTPLSIILSLIPPFTPVLMYARAVGGGVPVWQLLLGVLGMALSVLAIAWVAGRIYKVGILMTGKRPTLPELWRWVREA